MKRLALTRAYFGSLLLLAGCMTFPPPWSSVADLPTRTREQLIDEVGRARHAGEHEHALRVLDELAARSGWSKEEVARIRDRRIWFGQKREQFIASWGYPDDHSNHTSPRGCTEVWHYYRGLDRHYAVTIENGFVAGLSDLGRW